MFVIFESLTKIKNITFKFINFNTFATSYNILEAEINAVC